MIEEKDLELDTELLKRTLKKITIEHLIMVWLVMLLLLMYIIHTNDIAACNAYWQNLTSTLKSNFTMLWP